MARTRTETGNGTATANAGAVDTAAVGADTEVTGIADIATVATAAKAAEGEYSAAELSVAAYNLFGTSPDIAGAAFKLLGVERATVSDAKVIVRKFLARKVR